MGGKVRIVDNICCIPVAALYSQGMSKKTRYLNCVSGRYYWTPASRYRKLGFPNTPLGADREVAEAKAEQLTSEMHQSLSAGRRKFYRQDIFDHALRAARKQARARGLEFNLTEEALSDLLDAQDYRCALSRIYFDMNKEGGARRPYGPSVDRIDCSKGYIIGNVRVICTALNYALSDWGYAVFYRLAKACVTAAERKGRSPNLTARSPNLDCNSLKIKAE